MHEGESRVSPFAGGRIQLPPLYKEPHIRPPKRGVPKSGITYFPLWRRKGPAPGMKKMLCALSSFFEAGFVVGYIRSIRPAPP